MKNLIKKSIDKVLLLKVAIVLVIVISAIAINLPKKHLGLSDEQIRSRVVKLSSPHGSCSGQQVVAASGMPYILSAGHCRVLEENGSILVTTEDGRKLLRRVVAEDGDSDLLLLEAVPNLEGFAIADSIYAREEVRTFTHGRGYDTYITEGVVIQDHKVDVVVGQGENCPIQMSKFKVQDVPLMMGLSIPMCTLSTQETAITAKIVPGSSGGAIVDNEGRLIGVASATDESFGYMVRLCDIQHFLYNY